ncbi:hypothetical protein QQP08_018356 [Theobroma cacao]|nr:hypothetical protein QQP08_018356 [Theobroma cacao]
MYRTALFDSTIHPGNGDVSSSRLVGSRTPRDTFGNIQGPNSKPLLTTALSEENIAAKRTQSTQQRGKNKSLDVQYQLSSLLRKVPKEYTRSVADDVKA